MSIISTLPPTTIDRFARQQDFVPRERLTNLSVTLIGVGAIGHILDDLLEERAETGRAGPPIEV